jgi:hypothetical protein
VRCWLALLLLGGLAAGEVEPPVAPVPAPALAFNAVGGMSLSLSPDRPSEASGVRIRYEAVRLECDRLTYTMAALVGATRPTLSSADFSSGPDGRVLFDSQASQLPQVGFRGVLRPKALAVRRLDADPARPGEVRFRAEASDLGDIDGLLAMPMGMQRHVAWADRAVLDLVANASPTAAIGVDALRLVAMHFYGSTQPVRPATVLRLRPGAPPEPTKVEAQLVARGYEMRASGAVISLYFDSKGAMETIKGVEDFEGDGLVPMFGPNKPTIGK